MSYRAFVSVRQLLQEGEIMNRFFTLDWPPSYCSLGGDGSGGGRTYRLGLQVSETSAKAGSTSRVFQRAQEIGWTLDRWEALRTKSARQRYALLTIFSETRRADCFVYL